MAFSFIDVRDQAAALREMARLIAEGVSDPKTAHAVIRAARAITAECEGKDELCEVEAIYEAVKHGTSRVRGLEKGLRYVSDPRTFDYFAGPAATLKECEAGACAGDCDDATILVAALLLALGFKAGVRAWGPREGVKRFDHVYPVVALPKHGPWEKGYTGHGMDTTIVDGYPGWEPRKGAILTYWIEES